MLASVWGLAALFSILLAVPIEMPQNPVEGLPFVVLYQPKKSAVAPIRLGERRCDNFYHGSILPCLLRPWLPPFRYQITEGDNGEYKRK